MYKMTFKDLVVGDPIYYIKRNIGKELEESDIDSIEIYGLSRGRKTTVFKTDKIIPTWRFSVNNKQETTLYNRATVAYFTNIILSADLFELTRLIKKYKGDI